MIIFDNSMIEPYKFYGGANGGKVSIIYNENRHMIKYPPKPTKNDDMSYTNSCISEYISCHIINILGFNAQETILGYFNNKLVVACKDFEEDGKRLFEFSKIKNITIDTPGYETELDEIIDTINQQKIIEPKIVLEFFKNLFIIDAYLGNFDRHNGNWGFLIDNSNKSAEIAPIYDCGSCLFPQNTESGMRKALNDKREIDIRTYSRPLSSIKINNRRINYYEYFKSLSKDSPLTYNLNFVGNKILENQDKINNFIDSIDEITEIHKEFIKVILENRFEKIIKNNMTDIGIRKMFEW